jgi:hypothetical protein
MLETTPPSPKLEDRHRFDRLGRLRLRLEVHDQVALDPIDLNPKLGLVGIKWDGERTNVPATVIRA